MVIFSGAAQGSSALMIFAPWTKPKVKKKEMQTQRKNAHRSAITFGARKRPGASTERTNYKVSLIVFLFGEILDLSSRKRFMKILQNVSSAIFPPQRRRRYYLDPFFFL